MAAKRKYYAILGRDGSSNGIMYDTPEQAQRQIEINKRDYSRMWSGDYFVVESWVQECVAFCRHHFPGKVERWKIYDFDGME